MLTSFFLSTSLGDAQNEQNRSENTHHRKINLLGFILSIILYSSAPLAMVQLTFTTPLVLLLSGVASTVDAFAPTTSITQRIVNGVAPPTSASNRLDATELHVVKMPSVGGMSMPSINLAIDTSATTQYFLETLISNGVPAFFWIVVIAFAAKSFKSARDTKDGGTNGGLFG